MGTVAYMSPEQARGDDLDARTDLFSLGALLYEMGAGRLPFEGNTSGAIFGAILHESPPSLARLNPNVPAELERIVRQGARKGPASSLPDGVGHAGRSQAAETRPRIGKPPAPCAPQFRSPGTQTRWLPSPCCPSRTRASDPDSEYLSDGITESLINSLAQLRELRVVARSTVFRYKRRTGDPQQIGRELRAKAVLTGRVFLRGQTLVIGAELVDVANGWQLWGERYKRNLTDIFDVQEEIARIIVDKLRVKLSPIEERRLGKRFTDDPETYQLYLKGIHFLNKWTAE